MIDSLSRSAARNIFWGGSLFFFVVFAALTAHTHWYMVTVSTDSAGLTPDVAAGKHVWEKHSCINCHSLHGEGAYFAPELGNVWTRYGGEDNADGARAALKGWISAQPLGVPGRRQMPNFDLSDEELDQLVDFFRWADEMDTQGWPPNNAG